MEKLASLSLLELAEIRDFARASVASSESEDMHEWAEEIIRMVDGHIRGLT